MSSIRRFLNNSDINRFRFYFSTLTLLLILLVPLAALAQEIRRVTTHVEELHFLDLAGRLAMRLVRLAREQDPDADEIRLDWPYTQSDLASMIGGTRQSVNKLLSGLVDRGLVIIEKDTLLIPDVEALELEAER